jgi:hypothetical protein
MNCGYRSLLSGCWGGCDWRYKAGSHRPVLRRQPTPAITLTFTQALVRGPARHPAHGADPDSQWRRPRRLRLGPGRPGKATGQRQGRSRIGQLGPDRRRLSQCPPGQCPPGRRPVGQGRLGQRPQGQGRPGQRRLDRRQLDPGKPGRDRASKARFPRNRRHPRQRVRLTPPVRSRCRPGQLRAIQPLASRSRLSQLRPNRQPEGQLPPGR